MRSYPAVASCAAAALVAVIAAAVPPPSGGELKQPTIGLDSVNGEDGKNLVQTAEANGSFKTLLKAAEAAGLVDALSDENKKLTVFAPTDSAFKKIPKRDLDALLADEEKLKQVLLYHVVEGEVMAADVLKLDGEKVKTLSGKEIMVSVDGKKVKLNDNVKVTVTDIEASNGVIHVINTVLMPPMDE